MPSPIASRKLPIIATISMRGEDRSTADLHLTCMRCTRESKSSPEFADAESLGVSGQTGYISEFAAI